MAATNLNHHKAKKKDIEELIRLITLQKSQLEPNVSMFVQQTIASLGTRGNLKEATSMVSKSIQKDINRILVPFDETFTHDEIILLIAFYREINRLISFFESEAMKKFSKNGRKLFDPIYDAFRTTLATALAGNAEGLGSSMSHLMNFN